MTKGEDTNLIEQARELFRELEQKNPKAASKVAKRAFEIQERLAEIPA